MGQTQTKEAREHNDRVSHLGSVDRYWRLTGPTGDKTWNAPTIEDLLVEIFETKKVGKPADLVGEKLGGLKVEKVFLEVAGKEPSAAEMEIRFEDRDEVLKIEYWPVSYVLANEDEDEIIASWDNIAEATWEVISDVLATEKSPAGVYALYVVDDLLFGWYRSGARLCVTGYEDTTDTWFAWDGKTLANIAG